MFTVTMHKLEISNFLYFNYNYMLMSLKISINQIKCHKNTYKYRS